MLAAWCDLSSTYQPSSATSSITLRTSYDAVGDDGTTSTDCRHGRSSASSHGCTGATDALFGGRNESTSATMCSASSSSLAMNDATPLRKSCTCAPPSDACVTGTPVKPSTAAGPLT